MSWRDRERLKASLAHIKLRVEDQLKELRQVLTEIQADWQNTVDSVPLSLARSDNAERYEENAAYFRQLLTDLGEIETWLKSIRDEPNPTPSTNPAAHSQD